MSFELQNMVDRCEGLIEIKKSQLQKGDLVFLKTKNSIYKIKADDEGQYIVSGGWFDKNSQSPLRVKINGCTWGGSVIKSDIIAACGLFLEFGNRVVTSRIEKYFVIPGYKLS
jgi:hypothetical protein